MCDERTVPCVFDLRYVSVSDTTFHFFEGVDGQLHGHAGLVKEEGKRHLR